MSYTEIRSAEVLTIPEPATRLIFEGSEAAGRMDTTMTADFGSVVRDAETVDREIFEARADDERAWLDNGGIDDLAVYFEADAADADNLPY